MFIFNIVLSFPTVYNIFVGICAYSCKSVIQYTALKLKSLTTPDVFPHFDLTTPGNNISVHNNYYRTLSKTMAMGYIMARLW